MIPKIEIHTPSILAVDLGKFNSVFCHFDVATKKATFRTVVTDPEKFRVELLRQPGVSVVIEACSPAGWVHDLAVELGLPIFVANTNADAWAWKNVKRKTDKDDALKLARLAAVGELAVVRVPPKTLRPSEGNQLVEFHAASQRLSSVHSGIRGELHPSFWAFSDTERSVSRNEESLAISARLSVEWAIQDLNL
jgi:transposase